MADPWATPADVAEIAGAEVTDAQIRQAQAVVELRVGRTAEATPHIRGRDLRWLKQAVAYQAVWMADQPDLFTRSETSGPVIQDGIHISQTPQAQTMAPLALVALRRLSWRGNRSVHTESTLRTVRGEANPAALGVGAVYDYDGYERWRSER